MARTTCVTATYRPNGTGELYQCMVEVGGSYPDAADDARKQAVRGVVDLMREAIDAYAKPVRS